MDSNALVLGLAAGAAIPLRTYFRNLNRRTDHARDDADTAYDLSRRLELDVNLLRDAATNGDHLRLAYDPVQDLLVGLAYGSGSAGETPAVMPAIGAGLPPIILRPRFDEAILATHTAWPGATNVYTDGGLLQNPSNAFSALRTQAGAALGYNEVVSFLLGLTQPAELTQAQQAQIFRMARQFAAVGAGKNYTADQWASIWAAALSLPVTPNSGPRGGLLYSQQSRAPANIGASGAEEFAPAIPLPGGSFPVGRCLRIKIGWYIVSANGTNTARFGLRFGGAGGSLLYQTTGVDPANSGDYAEQTIVLTRQPDAAGGYPVITGIGESVVKSGAVGVCEALGYGLATPGGPASPGQLDAAFSLVPSILFLAADAANLARVEAAIVELL